MRLDGILWSAKELLDAQMWLDPFEKQLDLPARFVQGTDRGGRRSKQVGQEDERLADLEILEPNASQVNGVALMSVEPGQRNGLIADNTLRPIARCRIDTPEIGVCLGARDKEGASLMQRKEPVEVQAATIHDVNGCRLRDQQVECIDIVQFSIVNVDKAGDRAPQVQQRVQFDRRLGRAKWCPWEQRKTQIDRRGIERINRVRQIQSQVFRRVERARLPDEPLREFGVDTPIAVLVGIGQGGASHRRANAHVIELGGLCRQAGLDVAQAFAIGQLCKRQDAEVFGTGQRSDTVIATIARDDASECRPGQEIHQLREQGLADVHRESSGKCSPDDPLKALSRSSRHHQILAKKVSDSCSYTTIQPS